MSEEIGVELAKTARVLDALREDRGVQSVIADAASLCANALKQDGRIFLAGNGGSAADAQHIAAELVVRFAKDRPGMAAMALTTDASIMTAASNDYGYEKVFARQIEALSRPGDVFIGITTSGSSANILQALSTAADRGVQTVALTGSRGTHLSAQCDCCIVVPEQETSKVQEMHIVIGHIICGLVETSLFPAAVS